MSTIIDLPVILFVLSFIVLWSSALLGAFLRNSMGPLAEEDRADFSVVQGAALTLLSLLIGFTFSMAITRYDQRKNYEEAEANAIGTEYVRLGVLSDADAARARGLLKNYLDQRVTFYTTRDMQQLQQINSKTAQLQNDLWLAVQARGLAQPTPISALALSGMNDVLNSQGYTQAAWWNRIPTEAWVLLAVIAIGCNVLIGYGARRTSTMLFIVFPLAVAVAFFLIADIDSARGGLIRVVPQNLVSLARSLNSQ